MNPPPRHPWPPIIESARAPLLTRVRDFALTIAAWALFIYLVRDSAAIAVGDVVTPILALVKMHPREWMELAYDLRYYFLWAAGAVTWVAIWAIKRRRQLRLIARVKSPIALPVAQHAASFGLKPETLEGWRDSKVVTIQFDQEGHGFCSPPPPAQQLQ